MHHFLTTNQTEPPFVSALAYSLMMALLLLSIYASIKYYKNPSFIKSMKILQLCQLAVLYSWYVGFQLPLANSLPLYHCRLAMFAVVFLPDKWPSKQYFALLGASGAVFALGYPVFDPYDFPHITSFSFLVGHYALLVNSLIYLMNHYDKTQLKKYMIVLYTFVLDAFLVGVNQVTGGNYGLLKSPPFISQHNLLVKYLAVSIILSATLLLFDEVFKKRWKKQLEIV
ncbi:YwaF family protein [Streptococcus cristatus]|uniref:YwaF family protein n=1 Tax=Streptococcus cristatus TaxID=45634 RepID=UPI0011E7681D|nr:TIGR02206 family membrane protein [Streptococcus cristatus]